MEVALGSLSNVRELLGLLEVIESAQFSSLPQAWRKRTYRAINYHPGPVDGGADFVFYDVWEGMKIDHHSATNLASAIRVVPEDILFGLCHEEN